MLFLVIANETAIGVVDSIRRAEPWAKTWAYDEMVMSSGFNWSSPHQEQENAFAIGPGMFQLTGGLDVLIFVLRVSYQSVKAAPADPVKSLRYE